jgi:hypothetical protein
MAQSVGFSQRAIGVERLSLHLYTGEKVSFFDDTGNLDSFTNGNAARLALICAGASCFSLVNGFLSSTVLVMVRLPLFIQVKAVQPVISFHLPMASLIGLPIPLNLLWNY